jgi:hypothetical protein
MSRGGDPFSAPRLEGHLKPHLRGRIEVTSSRASVKNVPVQRRIDTPEGLQTSATAASPVGPCAGSQPRRRQQNVCPSYEEQAVPERRGLDDEEVVMFEIVAIFTCTEAAVPVSAMPLRPGTP